MENLYEIGFRHGMEYAIQTRPASPNGPSGPITDKLHTGTHPVSELRNIFLWKMNEPAKVLSDKEVLNIMSRDDEEIESFLRGESDLTYSDIVNPK